MKLCTGPHDGTPPEATAHDLCPGHYAQKRRHPDRPLRALRAASEYPSAVNFQCGEELKQRALAAASALGISEAEWWRRAGTAALKRRG